MRAVLRATSRLSAVSRAAMPEQLSAGDAFVFPVLGREGLPLNVLEALSIGLPCVCAESLRATFGALDGDRCRFLRTLASNRKLARCLTARWSKGSCVLPRGRVVGHVGRLEPRLFRRRWLSTHASCATLRWAVGTREKTACWFDASIRDCSGGHFRLLSHCG